jgi:hypothetical protein
MKPAEKQERSTLLFLRHEYLMMSVGCQDRRPRSSRALNYQCSLLKFLTSSHDPLHADPDSGPIVIIRNAYPMFRETMHVASLPLSLVLDNRRSYATPQDDRRPDALSMSHS